MGSDRGTRLYKQNFSVYNCEYFLTHHFRHMFWVLKRTVSLRRFFWVPTSYVFVEKWENRFFCYTFFNWRPEWRADMLRLCDVKQPKFDIDEQTNKLPTIYLNFVRIFYFFNQGRRRRSGRCSYGRTTFFARNGFSRTTFLAKYVFCRAVFSCFF